MFRGLRARKVLLWHAFDRFDVDMLTEARLFSERRTPHLPAQGKELFLKDLHRYVELGLYFYRGPFQ